MSHFHPQRLKPRYVSALARLSKAPGGLPMATRVFAPIAFDRATSTTENPTLCELQQAEIVVCGFPRTGTTFLQAVVNEAFGRSSACWKNHDVLGIRRYMRMGIPSIVTLRDPLDTAISWSIYNRDEPNATMLARRLDAYSLWHENVLPHLESRLLRLKPFADFREHPMETLNPLLQALAVSDEVAFADVNTILTRIDQDNHADHIALEHANVPHPDRTALKAPYRALTDFPQLTPHLDRARAVFNELMKASDHRPAPLLADLGRNHSRSRSFPYAPIATVIASASTTTAGIATFLIE